VKNHKLAKNSTTTKAGEKISSNFETLGFYKKNDKCLAKFKSNQIIFYKITAIYWVKEPH
jgi:hypothetical protein